MENFSDQAHIERLRTALWQEREFGKASVMVGSGFSRNAIPTSPSVRPFPTWFALSGHLVDELYPKHSVGKDERDEVLQQSLSVSGALRLAEEYEAAFGRDALESFLLSSIPDSDYEPGPLHNLLLKLPWADVLTTNYDTLLERAASQVVERRYQSVLNTADVPGATRPRIVKLHGSFPSTRPFIVTETDFRSYPRKFAPFVNLAQQVAMETVLCLLGFSGDDPNFLFWTGWVRDNLGKSAPQIYLCGLLNLNGARRNMLHDRNVVPIDLSSLFPAVKWPDSATRHARAHEWLLLNLHAGQQPLRLLWPQAVRMGKIDPSPGLPDLLKVEHAVPIAESGSPDPRLPIKEQLENLIKQWQFNRELYPGWLVASSNIRETLWDRTLPWLSILFDSQFVTLSLEIRLLFLFELNWRLERCLVPLSTEIADAIARILEEFDPFAGQLQLSESALKISNETLGDLNWEFAQLAWIELAMARLRLAREDQDIASFDLWLHRLQLLESQKPRLRCPLLYEECLFALSESDHDRVFKLLKQWDEIHDDPYWIIRRASLLAELGETDEAEKCANQGLFAIRSKISRSTVDVSMLSREGWALRMIWGLRSLQFFAERRDLPDFRGRWEQLAHMKCDPNPDWDFMTANLRQPIPTPTPQVTETYNLDGSLSRTYHMGPEALGAKLIPAYQAIRLIETVALPLRCGNVSVSSHVMVRACEWLAAASPEMATGRLVRAADRNAILTYFTPNRIALLADKEVAHFYAVATRSLQQGLNELGQMPINTTPARCDVAIAQIQAALALFSVLVLRASPDVLEAEILRAMNLYKSPLVGSNAVLSSSFRDYLRTIFSFVSSQMLGKYGGDLAALPIPGIGGFNVQIVELWPEPAFYFRRAFPENCRQDLSKWDSAIEQLLTAVTSSIADTRQRAVVRLAGFYHSGLLTPAESEKFGEALWSQVDQENHLPAFTSLAPYAFVNLPAPSPTHAAELFKAYYLNSKPAHLVQKITRPDGTIAKQRQIGGGDSFKMETIAWATRPANPLPQDKRNYIDWNTEEARRIFGLLLEWWNDEGKELARNFKNCDALFQQDIYVRLTDACFVLDRVIVPRIPAGDEIASQIENLLQEIEGIGVSTFSVMPVLLRLLPNLRENVIFRIRQGLVSNDKRIVQGAIRGVYEWVYRHEQGEIPVPPGDLLHEIGNILSARRQPGILAALIYSSWIARDAPKAADDTFIQSALVGLEYLLSETRYLADAESLSSHIPYSEIPKMRVGAVRLAISLMTHLKRNDDVIKKWVDSGSKDPLLQVRQAAADIDSMAEIDSE